MIDHLSRANANEWEREIAGGRDAGDQICICSSWDFLYLYGVQDYRAAAGPCEPLQLAITFLSLYCIYGGFFLPAKMFRRSEQNAQSASAEIRLKRWTAKGVMSFAYFEASILFGLVLRLLGGSAFMVKALMGSGIAAELLWRPGKLPITETGASPLS